MITAAIRRAPYPPRDRPAYGAGQGGAQGSGQGYPPRQSSGYQGSGQGSGQGYPPRQSSGYQGSGQGYPPRQSSGYQGSGQGYPPRQSTGYQGSGQGYPPRQSTGYQGSGQGYPPRQGGPHGPGSQGNFPGQSPRHGTIHRPSSGTIPSRQEPKALEKEIIRSAKPVVRSYAEEEELRKKAAAKDLKDQRPAKKAQPKAFDSRDKHGLRDAENEEWRRARNRKQHHVVEIPVIRPKSLKIKVPISVKDLAAEMKLKASQLIAKLLMTGVIVTLNDRLEDETTIQLLGQEFECEIQLDRREEERLKITNESIKEEISKTPVDKLTIRPPVVAFMGHVDHGKTSLIDAIRKSTIAQGEAGAITQHIGAFQATTAVGKITILDTPGHEAFSEMRARGADVTDIVVLVVAGDEGIKAQTIEAIEQAKAATVPVVVAINKSDKPGFNPENVYRQLADQNLLPEAWGGSIITVNCSAVTKEGIKELLEMLALQAEVLELKANTTSRARGTVIESQMHKGLGAVATVLVQNGTLRVGDAIVFATPWARVKTMKNEFGHEILEAPPSTPVKITGLSDLPEAGSDFIAVRSEKEARELSESRSAGQKHIKAQSHKKSLDLSTEQAKKTLYMIVKADVQGSLEAMKTSLTKILSTKVEVSIISSGIGQINESDVELAAASKAVILGFHSDIESHAVELVRQHKVQVKIHDIIYHAVDEVKLLMKGLLDKVQQENDTGKAVVKAIFKSSHLGNICGCQVSEGTIHRNDHIKVMRNDEVMWKGAINSLKRVKEDVREVSKGIECGIVINYQGVAEGDVLQGFSVSYLEQDI